jgi:hypothetical protein
MKIDNNVNIGQANPSSGKQPADAVDGGRGERANGAPGEETSRVSALARQIADAKRIADGLPDVRPEKVALARERLASGFYDRPEVRDVLVGRLAALVKNTSSR